MVNKYLNYLNKILVDIFNMCHHLNNISINYYISLNNLVYHNILRYKKDN